MANSKSAKKRIGQNEKQRQRNKGHRTKMRTAIKKLRGAIAEGDAQSAQELLPKTVRQIDMTAQKGVIHDNAAARYKSRLTKAVSALGA
jgi:small subunit ribosomal protein S20